MIAAISGLFRDSANPNTQIHDLYNRLEVPPTATSSEITKAFHKKVLEMDAESEVDKTQEQQDFEYERLKVAYQVLEDRKSRFVYDYFGYNAVRFYNDPLSMDYVDLSNSFSFASSTNRLILYLILILLYCLCLIVPILLCLRMDNKGDLTWPRAWIPFWIVDFFILCAFLEILLYTMARFKASTDAQDDQATQRSAALSLREKVAAIFDLLKFVLLIIFQAFLAARFENDIRWNWYLVVIPLFVLSALGLLQALIIIMKSLQEISISLPQSMNQPEHKRANFEAELSRQKLYEYSISFLFHIFSLWFAVMVAQKISETPWWSWWVGFLPLWIYIGIRLLLISFCKTFLLYDRGLRVKSALYRLSLILIFGILLAQWLQHRSFSGFIVFIPVYIVFYWVLCFMVSYIFVFQSRQTPQTAQPTSVPQ